MESHANNTDTTVAIELVWYSTWFPPNPQF